MTKDSSKGLGKGLEALFEETGSAFANVYEGKSAFTSYTEEERKNASEMNISDIYANPNQPRKNFDDQAMRELVKQAGENDNISILLHSLLVVIFVGG